MNVHLCGENNLSIDKLWQEVVPLDAVWTIDRVFGYDAVGRFKLSPLVEDDTRGGGKNFWLGVVLSHRFFGRLTTSVTLLFLINCAKAGSKRTSDDGHEMDDDDERPSKRPRGGLHVDMRLLLPSKVCQTNLLCFLFKFIFLSVLNIFLIASIVLNQGITC